MKNCLLLLPMGFAALTGCSNPIAEMTCLIDQSTEAIYCNICAVQHSTDVIRENQVVIAESTITIRENHRVLQTANE